MPLKDAIKAVKQSQSAVDFHEFIIGHFTSEIMQEMHTGEDEAMQFRVHFAIVVIIPDEFLVEAFRHFPVEGHRSVVG